MTDARHRSADDRYDPRPTANEHGVPSGIARRAHADRSSESAEWQARDEAEIDCAPMMIVRLDASGRVNHVNEAWRQFVLKRGAAPPRADGFDQLYLELVGETRSPRRVSPDVKESSNAKCPIETGSTRPSPAKRGRGERGTNLGHEVLVRAVSKPAAKAVGRVLQQLPAAIGAAVSDEYRCDVENALHWFSIEARRLPDGVLLMHTDISGQRRAEAHLLIQTVVSTALAGRQPLLSACDRIISVTADSLGWDFAAVWVPNDWQRLVCSDVWIHPRLAGGEFENLSRATSFQRGEGLPGRVWESKRPLWIHDLAKADSFPRLQRGRAIGLQCGFAVPLQCEGQVFGVIEFFSTVARPEDPELIELLSIAGFQLGADELRARAMVRAEAAEAGALLTRTQFDAISKNAPGYILWIDREYRIQFINRVMPQHRRDDIIGADCRKFWGEADYAAMSAKVQAVFDTGTLQHHELSMPGPDGREIWLSIQMGPMHEGEAVVGAVITSLDCTELKRTQLEFAAAQRWVSVGTLAAGIAHEINTPIQFVNDNLHFLDKAARRLLALAQQIVPLPQRISDAPAAGTDPELREALKSAIQATKAARLGFLEVEVPKAIEACIEGLGRVATIVQSLKEFAHPPSEHMEPTDINHVVERSLAIAISEYRYVADVETRFGELPPVRCHASEIGQVILNLVVNAAHAIADVVRDTERKGKLLICTWREDDQAIVSIGDSGTGIPEAIRPRIFDPFFTTKAVGKGTGQGLALAWAIIKQKHRGTLTFESTVGEGTTFYIRLPIAGAMLAADEPVAVTPIA